MPKIEAFARLINHAITDPTSGATIPLSNNHTDGSWTETDIYDREILINTGNGLMQYRAGNSIYNVAATTGSTTGSTKVVRNATSGNTQLNYQRYDIGTWDMSDLTPPNDIKQIATSLNSTDILSIDCRFFSDDTPVKSYNYDYGVTLGYPSRVDVYFSAGTINIVNYTGTYWADTTIPNNFSGTTFNRGLVQVIYK
jgi:hypothetical protein